MADPLYPNVPRFPGVPPVNRIDTGQESSLERLTRDAASLSPGQMTAWGIFSQKGALALRPDNITAFEFQREYRISDYPLEAGSFESFNKVTLPYDIRVIMTKGGSLADRKEFLDMVDALVAALDLFTIVTPERVYLNANLIRQDYRREATSGVSLLTVELHATEIRSKVSVQFVSSVTGPGIGAIAATAGTTHAPSGANPRNNGSVQALTPAQERLFQQGLPIDIGP
jgi:hypothetical protein